MHTNEHENNTIENQYLEIIRHNEAAVFGKVNFLLLAQSIFVLAFATLATTKIPILPITIAAAGILLAVAWLIWGSNSYKRTGELIEHTKKLIDYKNQSRKHPSSLYLYIHWREPSQNSSKIKANELFLKYIPRGFVVLWSVALLYKIIPLFIIYYFYYISIYH